MLRQAVKAFLHQHNRLTYSSLQCVMRQLQGLQHGSHRYSCRLTSSKFAQTCSYSTFGQGTSQKNLRKEGNKTHSGNKGYSNDNNRASVNDLDDEIKDEIDEFEYSVRSDRGKLDEGKLMDKFSDSEIDELRGNDLEQSVHSLVQYERQDVMNSEMSHDGSLVPTNTYYKPKSIVQCLLDEEEESLDFVSSETDPEMAELEEQHELELVEKGELKVQGVDKVAIPPLTHIAPIANDSEVLKKLVQLGVDLSEVQKKGMIDTVLKMNFKKDVGPYIWFLKDCGVPAEKVGEVVTRCPWMFQHDVHNIRVRTDYLRSKKFSKSQIANMLDKDPKFLLIPVEKIDAKLGFLQQEFRLTGKEIREKVSGLSKLIIAKPNIITENKFYMKKFLGFTEIELKTMFLTYPKIFLTYPDYVANRFDYLHNVMELPHGLIARTPQALNTTLLRLEGRHRYLVKCGRAQYDPSKPNYVSLMALITKSDETWCLEVAKTSIAEYNQFLRLI